MQSVETTAFEKNQTLGTPMQWRIGIALAIVLIALVSYFLRSTIGLRGQSVAGVIFFFGLVAVFSQNLRVVNWNTIIWGFSLQMILAVLVLKVEFVYTIISAVGGVVKKFIGFSDAGAQFVFGNLADARPPAFGGTWSKLFESNYMFQFAFVALPPILFVSAFFTLLYHFGILQKCVRLLARIMVNLMRTSGAETLSVSDP